MTIVSYVFDKKVRANKKWLNGKQVEVEHGLQEEIEIPRDWQKIIQLQREIHMLSESDYAVGGQRTNSSTENISSNRLT